MYVPYAIDVDGQIITMFDPITHESIETEADASSVIAAGAARSPLGPHPPAGRDGRRRADARHARPRVQPAVEVLRGADPAEGERRRVPGRRLRPAADAAAGPAEPLDRAAREPLRLPHAPHRQEIPGAVRRADRVRHQPGSRSRSPTKRSCAGSRTRSRSSIRRRRVHPHFRAELPAAEDAVPPGHGRLPASPPLRTRWDGRCARATRATCSIRSPRCAATAASSRSSRASCSTRRASRISSARRRPAVMPPPQPRRQGAPRLEVH